MPIPQYFLDRRTVRRFSDRAVDMSMITEMLGAAAQAPNTGNMQLYSAVVTVSPETIKALAPAHFNQPASVGCAAMVTFCADFNRFEHWCRVSDAAPGYDNFQAFIWAVIDATIFAQQFCTIAEQSGLGCCYLGTTTYNAPQIAGILDLPNRVVPVVTIALGWPDGEAPKCDRLPVDSIVHIEKYKDYSDDDIRDIYSYKESLPENKNFVSENGKETLAQVFTDVRYKKSDNEYFSKLYRDFIGEQGF